jgi:hypothetical protein
MGSSDFREQFTFVASQFDRFGLAYLHVVDGLAFNFHKLGEPMILAEFRKVFHGLLMGNCGHTQKTADNAIAEGHLAYLPSIPVKGDHGRRPNLLRGDPSSAIRTS